MLKNSTVICWRIHSFKYFWNNFVPEILTKRRSQKHCTQVNMQQNTSKPQM